jgi:hypothetical protein
MLKPFRNTHPTHEPTVIPVRVEAYWMGDNYLSISSKQIPFGSKVTIVELKNDGKLWIEYDGLYFEADRKRIRLETEYRSELRTLAYVRRIMRYIVRKAIYETLTHEDMTYIKDAVEAIEFMSATKRTTIGHFLQLLHNGYRVRFARVDNYRTNTNSWAIHVYHAQSEMLFYYDETQSHILDINGLHSYSVIYTSTDY